MQDQVGGGSARLPPGPWFSIDGAADIARLAMLVKDLERPAVAVSNGAVGWHLFAAMIEAAAVGDLPLTFVFDAGDAAGDAAEALGSGADYVLCEASESQKAALRDLARACEATLLTAVRQPVHAARETEEMRNALRQWMAEGR